MGCFHGLRAVGFSERAGTCCTHPSRVRGVGYRDDQLPKGTCFIAQVGLHLGTTGVPFMVQGPRGAGKPGSLVGYSTPHVPTTAYDARGFLGSGSQPCTNGQRVREDPLSPPIGS